MNQKVATALADAGTDRAASATPSEVCTYLDWDSQFFGKRIARLNHSRLNQSNISLVLSWCAHQRIDCLYFLCDVDDPETCRVAVQNKFTEVDVRVTLAQTISEQGEHPAMDPSIRMAQDFDRPALIRLAGKLHHDTRFYFDQRFERSSCDLLYEKWIEKSLADPAQTVFVPEIDGEPAGYIACAPRGRDAQIGLLGVGEANAGTGLGKKLVRHFLSWAARQGVSRATVVTQARNTAAQGLYRRCEFLPVSFQRWYHCWLTND
jgi:dTDP-4-amino-4,6-dideoxy-D-galactose acyltransferase